MPGKRTTAGSLQKWICRQAGLPPASIGTITIGSQYAEVEIDSRHCDRFVREMRRMFRR